MCSTGIDKADVILSLDADFLGSGPGGLAHARQFAARRRPEDADKMNRLYVARDDADLDRVEGGPSPGAEAE